MNNKKIRRVIVMLMLGTMLVSTLLFGLSTVL